MMSRRLTAAMLISLAIVGSVGVARSVPLRPDLMERLRSEGRVEEVREMLQLEQAEEPIGRHVATVGSIHALLSQLPYKLAAR